MAFLTPSLDQQAQQYARFVRKTEFQVKYLFPVLIVLCLIGIVFFPETEMKLLCGGLIVFLGLIIVLLRKVLLPKLRRQLENLRARAQTEQAAGTMQA